MIPVEIEDTSLTQVIVISFRMRERRHDGKFGQIKVDFEQKIDKPFDIVLRLAIDTEQDRSLYSDAMIMVTFHTLLDIIRRIVDGLIHIPGAGLCRQIKHFRVIFDRMTDPFLLERNHFAEEFHLPFFILSQRVVDDKQAIVFDRGKVFDHLIDRARAENTSAEVRNGTRITTETTAARSMKEIDHLYALVIIQFAFIEVAPRRPDIADGQLLRHVVVDFLQPAVAPVVQHFFHPSLRLAEEYGIGMVDRFFGMQHGRDTSEDHLFAAPPIFVGNSPSALHLRTEHHRDGYQIALFVEVEGFYVLVRK